MSRQTKLLKKPTRTSFLTPQPQCPPFFVVGEAGLTVMFSHAAAPLLLMDDGEIKPFPPDLSSDQDQAEFVLGHTRVGRA